MVLCRSLVIYRKPVPPPTQQIPFVYTPHRHDDSQVGPACSTCTYLNAKGARKCIMCSAPFRTARAAARTTTSLSSTLASVSSSLASPRLSNGVVVERLDDRRTTPDGRLEYSAVCTCEGGVEHRWFSVYDLRRCEFPGRTSNGT